MGLHNFSFCSHYIKDFSKEPGYKFTCKMGNVREVFSAHTVVLLLHFLFVFLLYSAALSKKKITKTAFGINAIRHMLLYLPLKKTILWSVVLSYIASMLSMFRGSPFQKRWIWAGWRETKCLFLVSLQKYFPRKQRQISDTMQ